MIAFVTGATGYLGAEIVAELLRIERTRVLAVGRNESRLQQLSERFREHAGRLDVETADLLSLPEIPTSTDVVIHAAAIRMPESPGEIVRMRRVNVEGTRRLLQLTAACGRLRFVYASTQSVYGWTGAPWNEDSPCCPQTEYAATKVEGERLTAGFSDRLGVSIVRLARLYGITPFTRWSELPGLFARRVVAGEPLKIRGSGESRLDFLHVTDAARLFVRLAVLEQPKSSAVFNAGSGGSVSVNRLAETFRNLAASRGLPAVRFARHPEVVHEGPQHLEMEIAKVKEEVGWIPQVSLEQGLSGYLDALEPRMDARPETSRSIE